MKKSSYIFTLLLLCSSVYDVCAGNLNGGFNTDSFPTVSFVWHENNPHIFGADAFKLQENDTALKFDVKVVDNCQRSGDNSYIILWEDMAVYNKYYNFYDFVQQVLKDFFKSSQLNKNDQFFVAAYNRTKTEDKTLRPLLNDFSNKQEELYEAVANYERSKLTFKDRPELSDAFPALNEALEMLNAQNNLGAKAIFIFTVGHALENSATNSVVSVQRKALELHIPIYVIQYAAPYGQSQKFQDLAISTYGMSAQASSADNNKNITEAQKALKEMYRKVEKRYCGHDYKFTYQTTAERGGEAVTLTIDVKGAETQLQMMPPPHNFLSWIKAHLILSIVCVVLLITLLTVGIVLFVVRNHKHDYQMQTLQEQQNNAAQQAGAAQQALENYKNDIKRQQAEAKNAEMMKELANIMRTKNMFPKLFVIENEKSTVFDISKPTTTIGRNNDNDLVLAHNAVSRHHAQIIFNGVDFVIEDLDSKNNTFVNGQIVQGMYTLKAQDKINIGQALITFKI